MNNSIDLLQSLDAVAFDNENSVDSWKSVFDVDTHAAKRKRGREHVYIRILISKGHHKQIDKRHKLFNGFYVI
jgi:hypothetical protein